jgi:hypothetical protein
MAEKRPIIRYPDTGRYEELRLGDTLPSAGGSGSPITTVAVTFPSSGSKVLTQTVTVSGATLGQKIICSALNDTDELEMDMLVCSGVVTATDTVKLTVSSIGEAHHGVRNINIQRD